MFLSPAVRITDPTSRSTACGIAGSLICGWPAPPTGSAVEPDIERYMTAHSKKDEHGGYGEYPAKELKAVIE